MIYLLRVSLKTGEVGVAYMVDELRMELKM